MTTRGHYDEPYGPEGLSPEALRVRTDLYAMLARTNRAVNSCTSADDLFAAVCRIAVETGGFRFAWIGVPGGVRIVPAAMYGEGAEYLDGLEVTIGEHDPRSQGPTGTAFRTGGFFVANDFMRSPRTVPWHDRGRAAGFAASAAFPIKERGRVAAVLTVYAATPHFFTDELVSTLSEITPTVSFALDKLAGERDRLRDEADLRLRDRAMQAIAQGITIVDARAPDYPIVYASPSFQALTGYDSSEVIGRNCRFLQGAETDPAAANAIRDALERGAECEVDILNYRKDGTPFWNALTISPVLDGNGVVTHFVGVQTDVTEKRRMEEQARQSQRLESLGQLAGGVAHDFNNLLTVIMGNALLVSDVDDPDARRALDDIVEAGSRATELVRQLLAFSRQQVVELSSVDLNAAITSARRMLDRLIETSIEVRYDLSPDPITVVVDRGQLEQVLVNLAVNARDAMPDGGVLTIRTDADAAVGRVAVEDTGTGIEPAQLDRIFVPFFTTKEIGKGTGLGLAAVHGIVESVGGTIAVDSRPGRGSTFTVSLPLADGSPAEEVEPAADATVALQPVRALLVEDDNAVRDVTERLLLDAGCELVRVASPEEAVAIADRGEQFDVLITDLVMPLMNGVALASTIRRRRPGLPVVFVSGYPRDKFDEVVSFPQSVYLAKPLKPGALREALNSLLA